MITNLELKFTNFQVDFNIPLYVQDKNLKTY
jgi:hypothetical protein